MKNIRIFGIILILSFFVSSCLEYQFTTRINSDGSCERIMTVRGDSSDLMDGIIPVPRDTAWTIKIVKMQGEGKKYELTATAKFSRVEELNRYFTRSIDSMPTVSVKSALKKKFRWFYTYLVYTETYQAFTPYRKVPVDKYLKDDEIKILFADDNKLIYVPDQDILRLRKDSLEKSILNHADSLKMEKKKEDIENRYNNWLIASLFEEVYSIVLDRAGKMNDPGINPKELLSKKDTIFNAIKKSIQEKTNLDDLGSNSWSLVVFNLIAPYLPAELKTRAESLDSASFTALDKRYEKMQSVTVNTYASQVAMPGLITSTNAGAMNGNLLSWEVEPGEFFFKDDVLMAEARVANRWTFWTTGILVLVLTGLLIGGTLGKKHKQ